MENLEKELSTKDDLIKELDNFNGKQNDIICDLQKDVEKVEILRESMEQYSDKLN